jgi:hypothetical protein
MPRDRNTHRRIEIPAFLVPKAKEIANLLFEKPLNNKEQGL